MGKAYRRRGLPGRAGVVPLALQASACCAAPKDGFGRGKEGLLAMYHRPVTDRLAHLLTPRVFTGDQPMGWALVAKGDEPHWQANSPSQAWMAQGVFRRLVALGRAYSLHTLGNLDPVHSTRLGSAPARSLREEFGFLASFVADPVAKAAMGAVLPLLGQCEHHETHRLEPVIRAA